MKKIFTIVAGLMLSIGAVNAQSNLNLDSWTDEMTPDNWNAGLNGLLLFVGDTSVVRTTGSTGFAAKQKPVDLSIFLPGYYASLLTFGPTGDGDAYSNVNKLESAEFQLKFVGAAGNSILQVGFALTKFNTNTNLPDTIATASFTGQTEIIDFEKQTIAFEYDVDNGNLTPDSIKISSILLGTDSTVVGTVYSVIDEIQLIEQGPTAVKNNKFEGFSVFPTLANNNVNYSFGNTAVSTINVSDLSGKTVKSVNVNGTAYTMNVSDLKNGVYIYNTVDKNGNAAKTGKFVVIH